MQVYKTFFRIFRQHKGSVILYLCIFMGVALIISSSRADDEGKKNWQKTCYPFAVFDEDDSELSKGLVSYVEKHHEKVAAEDREELLMDELYERNLVCVLRIPKGFGDSLKNGRENMTVGMTTVPGSVYSRVFQSLVSDYVNLVRHWLKKGDGLAEALQKAAEAGSCDTPVTVDDSGSENLHSSVYYFFLYLPYILISVCVVGIGPSVMVFQRRAVKHRSQCSAYPEIRINIEILSASVTIGTGLCILYFLLVLLGTGSGVLSYQGFLYILNMFSFLPCALGIAFLAGQVFQTNAALTMAANVIGLGMSVLGGIFFLVVFLGGNLAKAARFLPSYWHTYGNGLIDRYTAGKPLTGLWQCMGIQILFGTALFCVSLAWLRGRMDENNHTMYKE